MRLSPRGLPRLVLVHSNAWRSVDPEVRLITAQDEASINAYLWQYLYEPLQDVFPLLGLTGHAIKGIHEVTGLIGQPDFVAIAIDSAGQSQLLFAAATKTKMAFSIPQGSTTARAWQESKLQEPARAALQQLFGYMTANHLRYSLLTTGEVFVFLQREGRSLQVADVHRTSTEPTPMAGLYYLMQRWVVSVYVDCIQSPDLPWQPLCMRSLASVEVPLATATLPEVLLAAHDADICPHMHACTASSALACISLL